MNAFFVVFDVVDVVIVAVVVAVAAILSLDINDRLTSVLSLALE